MSRLILLFLLLCPSSLLAAPPDVVVSLKPLHSLATAIMRGVATPHLLLRGGESPHSYALRPSDAKALAQAELVIWVGPELETFLEKGVAGIASKARSLPLLNLPGLVKLSLREGGDWEADDHAHHAHHAEHAAANPHIWLDPANAERIAAAMTQTLVELDPQNEATYRHNYQLLAVRLQALDTQLAERLAALHESPYLVFHDAYHYLENRYKLNAVGSVTVSPERLPGARKALQIRKKIKDSGALCIFSEPQFKPQMVESLIGDTGIRAGVLDPLGTDLPAGEDAYFRLLEQLATGLESCLQPAND